MSGRRKKVLWVATSRFPAGQAYSTRIHGFARMFQELGWDFHAITDYGSDDESVPGRVEEFESGTYQVNSVTPGGRNRAMNALRGAGQVASYLSKNRIDLVVVGNVYDRWKHLKRMAERASVPVVVELCEWFDEGAWRLGKLDPYRAAYTRRMQDRYAGAHGFIAISRLLEQHLGTSGMPTVRIPTVMDIDSVPWSDAPVRPTRLVHLGINGNGKEEFAPIVSAVNSMDSDVPVRYEIYGSSREAVESSLDPTNPLLRIDGDRVVVHGRIPFSQTNQVYRDSSFSIFVRPDRRSSHAGFPTKLAESMAAGTPVVSNLTGDVGLHLEDGLTGKVLADGTAESVRGVLDSILEMSDSDLTNMRRAARREAEKSFSTAALTPVLYGLLREVGLQ